MLAAKYSACRPSANDLLKALETVVVDKMFNGDGGNVAYNERQADHPWAEDITPAVDEMMRRAPWAERSRTRTSMTEVKSARMILPHLSR